MSEFEAAASREFLLTLVAQLRKNDVDASDVELVVERLVPVLVPAVIRLLKTVSENERREHEGEQHVLPVKPLDHIAKFLFRHNPRHTEPDKAILELQDQARRLLRK